MYQYFLGKSYLYIKPEYTNLDFDYCNLATGSCHCCCQKNLPWRAPVEPISFFQKGWGGTDKIVKILSNILLNLKNIKNILLIFPSVFTAKM